MPRHLAQAACGAMRLSPAVVLRERAAAAASMRRVDPLLGNCSLSELRQRKSEKWREYPPEVLEETVRWMASAI